MVAEPSPARVGDVYVQVAVALPLPQPFTYRLPAPLRDVVAVGHGVLVPFGPRRVSGFVVGHVSAPEVEVGRVKEVVDLLALEPLFDEGLLPFFQWIAQYYHHPLGEVLRTALPSGVLQNSRRHFFATPEGEEAVEGCQDQGEARLLRRLIEAGPGGLAQGPLQRIWEGEGLLRALQALLRRGWISADQRVTRARAQERTETLYRLTVQASSAEMRLEAALSAMKRVGPVQKEVLTSLSRHGEVSARVLRQELASLGVETGRLPVVLRGLQAAGLVEARLVELMKESAPGMSFDEAPPTLSSGQQRVVGEIESSLGEGSRRPFLLQGVTGSGKTEVYLRLASSCLERGRTVIVLVPEIGLTPQLLGRFRARFGEEVACLHSGLSDQERFDTWRRARRGEIRVVVGARSAIFTPFVSPGLIVVDEEHDPSFKQDDGLRYNGRDVAVVRAQMAGAVVVLGSATPSLETRHNAERGRFARVVLPGRVTGRPLPEVTAVDMRQPENLPPSDDEAGLSPPMRQALEQTFAGGGQAIVLLNRRGFSPFVLCPRCGYTFRCGQCDVSLTFHQRRHLLICHHCGGAQRFVNQCPQCGGVALELCGQGTERLEAALDQCFPGVAVARLDRDTASSRHRSLELLEAFRAGRTQLLVGTQMLAKGHDFPGVTLVGILQADAMLSMPDFRAAERTFQLVTQVAGRAGRGQAPGRVLVQSYNPTHYSLAFAAQHDFNGFYEHELRLRQMLKYPPFSRLALVHVVSAEERPGQQSAAALAEELRTLARAGGREVEVMGPAPSPIGRLLGRWRYQILLKSAGIVALQGFLHQAVRRPAMAQPPGGITVSWDVDPVDLL